MNASLREQYCAASFYRLDDAVDHDPAGSIQDVNYFFSVWVRMGWPYRLAGMYFDHTHRAMLRVCIVFRYDPTETAAGNIMRFYAVFVHNGELHRIVTLLV